MNTKLTLRVDSLLIKQAKIYAKQHGKSVSQMVGDYFSLLNATNNQTSPVLPLTASLRGVLKNTSLSEQDYKSYLDEKYL